ncbi:MAG: cysteine desulfurase NifS [Clostridia bacterium]|nr:cysteine desulfurase NifS [Clostridia bacterium]
MANFVYADNAATTSLSPKALEAMMPFFQEKYGNPSSLYRFGQDAKTDLDVARAQVAEVLNAKGEEIFFTSGGTESDNWAIRGVAELRKAKGKHIITSSIEHHAIVHTLQYLEKQGYEISWLPVDGVGRVDPQAVKAAIRPDTILITIMAANNEIGTVEPIAEIGKIAREAGVLFHTDAVQAVGHIGVDAEALNVDLLSLSAHKFHGPRGVGALYVRKGLRLPPLIIGGGQEKGRRSGTENVAGAVGLAAALKEAAANLESEGKRLAAMRDRLFAGLKDIPCTRITGDRVNRLPGTASFVFEGVEGEALLLHLDAKGICASSGSACSSATLDPSHVLLGIGLPHAVAHGSLRVSLGAGNTEEDVDTLIREIPAVVEYLRKMSPVWDDAAQKPTWEL